jgi:hypothetical protein
MSESRDRAMRRSRGTSRNVIDGKVKLERARSAGQHEQVVFPSPEAVKEAVLAGICPCCGKGPFVLLARHTHAQHGIDKRQLRDLAGLAYTDSITSAAHQELRRKIALGLIEEGKLWPPRKGARRPTVVSAAGKERRNRKPSEEAPPCANCGRPARHKDASHWTEAGRVSGGWLKSCSDECAGALRRAHYASRTKARPACMVCGTTIPMERGRPGRAETYKTCSSECQQIRRQRFTDELLERVALAYLRESEEGRPPGTMKRLAAEFGRPEETVRSWVVRARALGWLGPARSGRRGAEPGPRLKPPPA